MPMSLEDAKTFIVGCLARGATGPEERQTLKEAERVVLRERYRIMRKEVGRRAVREAFFAARCPDCGKDLNDPNEPHATDCSEAPKRKRKPKRKGKGNG